MTTTTERPVALIGAGFMGVQIASMFARGGVPVRFYDIDPTALERAERQLHALLPTLPNPPSPASLQISGTTDLAATLQGAWLVVEAVPERLELKVPLFGELDRLAEPDALLTTNSSSYKSSELIAEVAQPERVLNAHFYHHPWKRPAVELMSCGRTDPILIERLAGYLHCFGFVPFVARQESTGFIFNRIWAAIKRESLAVVAEGVATPEEVDQLWTIAADASRGPFAKMDAVGLDVVLDIERHYVAERPGLPDGPVELLQSLIARGKLGVKSGEGFYRYDSESEKD